jgi:hypothetical protein
MIQFCWPKKIKQVPFEDVVFFKEFIGVRHMKFLLNCFWLNFLEKYQDLVILLPASSS